MKFYKMVVVSIFLSIVLPIVFVLIGSIFHSSSEPIPPYSIIGGSIYALIYLSPILVVLFLTTSIAFVLLRKKDFFSLRWRRVISFFIGAGVTSLLLFVFAYLSQPEETNHLYLIPEGYTGDVYVFYHIKGAPKVKMEGDYVIHPINDNGYFVTSTEEMNTGLVTDQYFYVDDEGNRTRIDETCTNLLGSGGSTRSTDDGEEINFEWTGFKLTDTCREDFRTENHHAHPEQFDEIVYEILNKYYGYDRGW